jgi:uncharacterized protein (TIGR02145 family)
MPSWEINGGYWQWGRKEMAAAGPSGPGGWQANGEAVAGWSREKALNSDWQNGIKTANDPCPLGYRVPTQSEWKGVLENNNISNVGTWEKSVTNYSSGKNIGDELFLPAAGSRNFRNGVLSSRGYYGFYWSSTNDGSSEAWSLDFSSKYTNPSGSSYRADGQSVRCIAE